jgi:hypothetical protein
MSGPHASHVTRFSDASSFDEICVNCGATDEVPGGWGALGNICPEPLSKICNCKTLPIHTIGEHIAGPPKR